MRSRVIFDLPALETQIATLQTQSEEPDLWNDPDRANALFRRLSALRERVRPLAELRKSVEDLVEFIALLEDEPNDELEREALVQAKKLLDEVDAYELRTLLSGEYDERDALVEINAGAGGSEACDWASMLFRMYVRWAERRGFKAEVLSQTPGDVTGFRGVSLSIRGPQAYGYVRQEAGVHRLVRISPFDAAARRHTSFAKVEVLPEIEQTELDIPADDLKVETLRAGGAGGQHVNKTESAVRITHVPSGIVVQCQSERSQHANRAAAMTVLASRLAAVKRAETEEMLSALKGDSGPAEWGRQIRSYVLQPYTMVKDHRTGHETGNTQAVLDGDIDAFIEAMLRKPPDAGTYVE